MRLRSPRVANGGAELKERPKQPSLNKMFAYGYVSAAQQEEEEEAGIIIKDEEQSLLSTACQRLRPNRNLSN